MKIFGVDISRYQANMDLAKAKQEGVNFTIIRGAYGRSKDTAFESNYTKAKNLGLGVGVYWWTRATSESAAKSEATYLINNVLKGKQFEYPIYIDVEDKLLASLGKSKVDAIIRSACETLENAGYYAGFYMNSYWFKINVMVQHLLKDLLAGLLDGAKLNKIVIQCGNLEEKKTI